MQQIILRREDFNSELHPRMFDELCEQFDNLLPVTKDRDVDTLTLTVIHADAD